MFLSMWTNCFKGSDLKSSIEKIADAGFNYAELASLDLPEEEIDTINAYCAEKGLKLYQAHGKFGLGEGLAEESDALIDYKKEIKIASRLGIIDIVYHPMHPKKNESISIDDYKKLVQRNVDFFKQLIPDLEKYNVKIALENMPYGAYTYAEELLELLDALDSDCFGICMDTSHLQYAGENISRFIMQAGQRIIATHMSDSLRDRDLHLLPVFGPGYEGWVDWYKVKDALIAVGYNGGFNLEIPGETACAPLWLNEQKVKFAYNYLAKYLV